MVGQRPWLCFILVSTLIVMSLTVVRTEEAEAPAEAAPPAGEAAPEAPAEPTSSDEAVGSEKSDGAAIEEEEDVLVLTDQNFDDVIANNRIILVEFYAPWCGHCKSLAPEYAKAAKELKAADPAVPLGKVDATVQTVVAGKHDISGYPTLKLFRDGKPEDFDGPRDAAGIVQYVKEKSDPNYKPPPEAVITLTKDNFKEVTEKEAIMLVEFYAPWCGHCKKIAPELEKAAQQLKGRDEPILIGKVDATVEKELAEEYKVEGYPTMKVFRNGKASEYKGPREGPGIADYMIRHSGDATTLYALHKDVKEFLVSNGDGPVFLGLFKDLDDPLYKLFVEANDELREDYQFGHTFDAEAKKVFGLKGESAIVVVHPEYMISKYEKRYQFYKDTSGNAAAIQDFYKKYQVPLVGHFTQDTEQKFAKRPLVLVFFDVSFDAKVRSLTQYWREKVIRVAREYPDILFAVANEESYEDKMKEFGLTESGEDVNVGLYDEQDRKFALIDEEFSEDSLTEFIDQWKKGKLKPILKSQPVAPRAKPGKVQVVVGNSFDDIVMDESKEVFIEFYAPWCGHCKKLEPVYNKLAKAMKDEKDIVIAKIDATANDYPPSFKVEGFPTLFYVLPGKKSEPIKFESGQRDMEGMKKFIEEHSEVMKKSKRDEL